MKKIIKVVFVVVLMFGLVGCATKKAKEPKEIMDILKKEEYILYFKTSKDGNYYNEKLEAHKPAVSLDSGVAYPGNVINVYRLKEEPKEISMEIRKGVGICFAMEEDTIHYTLNNVTYTKNTKTDDETYNYAIAGQSGKDKEVKESYTKLLEGLDITEDELLSFYKWSEENIQKEVLGKLQESYKNKQPLTNDQMNSFLTEQGVLVEKTDSKLFVIDSDTQVVIYYLNGKTAKESAICVMSTENFQNGGAKDAVYLNYFNDSLEATTILGTELIYDMTAGKGAGGTPQQIEELSIAGKSIKESYLKFLDTCNITENEFKTFIATY